MQTNNFIPTCLFCQVISKKISSYQIYEDANFYAFLDIKPVKIGHTLLVPKVHCQDLLSSKPQITNGYIEAIKKINTLLTKALQIKGLTIINNNGLGQEITHLHWHLIPRYHAKDLTLPLPIECDLEKIANKIKHFN